jgi:NADPH:quinone reductase-like Zn-dependent oxidoreductase
VRAIVQDRYGPIDRLRVGDVDTPTPRADEVLVWVRASSVHVDAWHTVVGLPYALRLMGNGVVQPRAAVPGTDVSGVVEAVGSAVTRFRPGDEVMGETVRGIQWRHGGAWAEHACAPEDGLVLKPAGLTFDEAAAVGTPAVLAYEVLVDQAGFRAGHSLLVNGAAGALGLWVVQLALALGASRVVGVDHPDKLDVLRSVGVHEVVDYTREDPTRVAGRVDVVIDVASTRRFQEWRRVLQPRGTFVLVGHDHYGEGMGRWVGSIPTVLGMAVISPLFRQLPGLTRSTPRLERLEHLARLLDEGKVRPVVDSTYDLTRVTDALHRLTSGRAAGRIVLTV